MGFSTSSLFSSIDFSGVITAAMAGSIEAKRNRTYQFDFVGVIGLALISALGGGITRDILLQHGPPLAFTDIRYLIAALAGGSFGLLYGSDSSRRLGKLLFLIDAAALGLFSVAGAARALWVGFRPLPTIVIGTITAVGGGALRDVFSGRTPKTFEHGEPYTVVAAVVAMLFLVCGHWTGNQALATSVGVASGFAIRVLALKFRWRTKAAR